MSKSFRNPKGTRDFYPEELLRRRYIAEQWRAASVRHAFEEIDGPTFEHADLYTVKSGEGILSELFSFKREGGDDLYALRPEFTPTLARMYAAKAASLPKPVRWFCIPSFFRAEKPQRGRLREFFQWNCDVIGEGGFAEDAEVVGVLVGALEAMGVGDAVRAHMNHRTAMATLVEAMGVEKEHVESAFVLLDRREKLDDEALEAMAYEFGINEFGYQRFLKRPRRDGSPSVEVALDHTPDEASEAATAYARTLSDVEYALRKAGIGDRCVSDPDVVRGLAYYTGTVFEVLAQGERAVAGGGRYDNLIELFGGPPTPACGFGMGDVVLGNLLEDHGLFPAGHELRDAIDRVVKSVSLRPEVFVVSGGEEHDQHVPALMARLRRGEESSAYQERASDAKPWDEDRYDASIGGVRPLHVRTTGKSTRNLKKLLAEAEKLGAKTAAIVHGPDKVQLKNLRTREDIGDFAIDRSTSNALGDVGYVGDTISEIV